MTVFEFTDFREFIKYRVSQQLYTQEGRKKSNLERVAKSLGYASPSLLSMVMSGKRLPSDEFCEALLQNWNLPLKEREYFRLLVQLDRKKKTGADTTGTVEQIRKVAGNQAIYTFKESEFSILREWYFFVIKLMVESPSFREDPVWISRSLRRKITPHQAQQALLKMEQLGLLVRDPETKRLKPVYTNSETGDNIPSSAIRMHHREMLLRGMESIEDRPVEERLLNSLSIHVDPSRAAELRNRLIDFVKSIHDEFASAPTDSVYQLNLQFFEHTTSTTINSLSLGESHENN